MYKYSIADIDSPSQDANIKLEKLSLQLLLWWKSANTGNHQKPTV